MRGQGGSQKRAKIILRHIWTAPYHLNVSGKLEICDIEKEFHVVFKKLALWVLLSSSQICLRDVHKKSTICTSAESIL